MCYNKTIPDKFSHFAYERNGDTKTTMKLFQLQYFQEVCNQHSITKAAECLHVSQPAISNAIRDLEEEFQIRLFKREKKKLILTKEGTYFLLEIKDFLEEEKKIERNMRLLRKKVTSIRLGLPPMISALLIPTLADFHRKYPDIRIECFYGSSASLRKSLQEDQVDVIVVSGSDLDFENQDSCRFSNQEIVYCVNEEHPLANEKSISIVQTAPDSIVEIKESSHFRHIIMKRYEDSKCEPNITWSTEQLYNKLLLIKQGVACGFLYRAIAEKENGIVPLSLDPPIYYDIEMIWMKNGYLYDNIQTFLTYIKEQIS